MRAAADDAGVIVSSKLSADVDPYELVTTRQ
jgi:hypothetical protein